MKKLRRVLATMLAACCFLSIIGITEITQAESTTSLVYFNKTIIDGGETRLWDKVSNDMGWLLVRNETQVMKMNFAQSGVSVSFGFRASNTGTYTQFYSGTVSGTTKKVSSTVSSYTHYKPYLTNNSKTGYITVKSSSYMLIVNGV